MTTAPGTTIGPYRIERLLGRGGMGEVWLATDEDLARPVALKLLPPELASDPPFRTRFLAESRLAASLDHPHIVPIYEAGETDGRLFIAMRYVEGGDLGSVIARSGPLEPGRTVALLRGIADALDAAHDRGLVHRDVKPGNILVSPTARGGEHAYLADFGLVKQLGSSADFTRAGQIVGSLGYIAPEQIEGRPIDARTDVYSLACVLYECLTGRPPFAAERDVATLWAHLQSPRPRPSEIDPELARFDPVIARGMAIDPAERFASAGELLGAAAEAAEAVGASGVSAGGAASTVDRDRRGGLHRELSVRAAVVILIVGVAATAIAVAGAGGRPAEGAPPSSAAAAISSVAVTPAAVTATALATVGSALPAEEPHSLLAGRYANERFDPSFTVDLDAGWFLHNSYVDHVTFTREEDEEQAIDIVHIQVVYPTGCYPGTSMVGRASDDVVKWIQTHPVLSAGSPQPVNLAGISGLSIDAQVARGGGAACATDEDLTGARSVYLFPVGGYGGEQTDVLGLLKGTRLRFIVLEIAGRTTTIIIRAPADSFDPFLKRATGVLSTLTLSVKP